MNATRTFLADVPLAPPPDGTARSRIQIAKTGAFKDPRWGSFAITRDDFAEWTENFHKVTGEVLVDADHGSERPGGSSAARGWIKGLEAEGDKLYAVVAWTRLGVEAIRDSIYKWISPTFGPYRDEQGNTHKKRPLVDRVIESPVLEGDGAHLALAAPDPLHQDLRGGDPHDRRTPHDGSRPGLR